MYWLIDLVIFVSDRARYVIWTYAGDTNRFSAEIKAYFESLELLLQQAQTRFLVAINALYLHIQFKCSTRGQTCSHTATLVFPPKILVYPRKKYNSKR